MVSARLLAMDDNLAIEAGVTEGMGSVADTFYRLQVSVIETGARQAFAAAALPTSGTVEVSANQTLHHLRESILRTLGRRSEYLQLLASDCRHDCSSIRYRPPGATVAPDPFDAGRPVGNPRTVPLASLDLRPGQSFGCWFDLWDDWHCEIVVVAVRDTCPGREHRVLPLRQG